MFDSRLFHGNFPCRGRIPVVTVVWVVSRFRLKVETSSTRSQKSINSDWTYEISSLEGTSSHSGVYKLDSQTASTSAYREYVVLWLLITEKKLCVKFQKKADLNYWVFFTPRESGRGGRLIAHLHLVLWWNAATHSKNEWQRSNTPARCLHDCTGTASPYYLCFL